MLYTCDWSHWQSHPANGPAIEREGFAAVWIKSSGASSPLNQFYIDPTFQASLASVRSTGMVPGVYHYLVPGYPGAQAAFLSDLLGGNPKGVMIKLDVEHTGLVFSEVVRFLNVWKALHGDHPIWVYSSKSYWQTKHFGEVGGILETAHWVPSTVRSDPAKKYASQQAKAIDPAWWTEAYGAWKSPVALQFTDNALVDGVRTTASLVNLSKADLKATAG